MYVHTHTGGGSCDCHVMQDTELKVAIVELVIECVSSQPGMMELFLSIEPDKVVMVCFNWGC